METSNNKTRYHIGLCITLGETKSQESCVSNQDTLTRLKQSNNK